MIKAVIFDFDGVILESANIKTEAFRELFLDCPEKVEKIVAYHVANGGISRYVKFRHIYGSILRQELKEDKELELGARFSRIVLDKVLNAPFVAGAIEFLDVNKGRYLFFIASGTPEEELLDIIRKRNLSHYFKAIYGSPKKKAEIIDTILKENKLDNGEVVYVGDAESDRKAAKEAGIAFIERKADMAFCDITSELERIEKLEV